VNLTGGGLTYGTSGNLGVIGTVSTSGDIVLNPLGALNSTGSLRSGSGVRLTSGNNMTVTGPVSAQTVRMAPGGNLTTAANNFASSDIRALTKDFFGSYPNNAGIVGTRVRFGVNSLEQLGPNEIGVVIPLQASTAAPYISEFTTGTGQPYILASQNAVPAVMIPGAISGTGAFAARVTYSPDELEMMTPEERAAYEAQQRRQSQRRGNSPGTDSGQTGRGAHGPGFAERKTASRKG
ncbi:MAG: hypothetical protein EBT57_06800, partial [Verrucomicrobia bacterium]|nr:hypothetical protein [Verrucomicrobiota bacterium]